MLESTTGGKKNCAHAHRRRGRPGVRAAALAGVACAALSLWGCGGAADSLDEYSSADSAFSGAAGSAATAGAARPPEGSPSGAAHSADGARAGQLARGEILSFACRPCHGLAPGDESPVGPHLYGMFGRPAARVDGFEYSAALRGSGIVWTAETLDAWLAQPEVFLPGNDMDFAGFRSADDRQALIEYLRRRTAAADTAGDAAAEATQAPDRASN